MSEGYVECLVKAKQPLWANILKVVLIVLTVVFVLSIVVLSYIGFLLALAGGAGVYFLNLMTDLEYEYLYLDKELVIDKVMAKSKRKRVGTYPLSKMEIVAPFRSYQLDSYRRRQCKVNDFSIGEVLKPDMRYAIYCEGNEMILFSPSQEMVKAMKNAAPRKVFTE